MTGATVEVRGAPFRVTSSPGPGGGRPLVLVHGIGISSRAFARLHAELSVRAPVHSVDLPGFGPLPRPDRTLDVAGMAELLGEAIAARAAGLGAGGPVVAVGNSMGAQWVVELARQRPDLVSHVVTIGPVVNDRRRGALAQGAALLADSLREPWSANRIVLSDYLRCGVRWYLRQLRHMLRYRIEERVAGLAQPLLVVRGGRDPIAPADWCARLAGAAPRARIAEIPGQPHLAQHTAPAAVADAIAGFLAEGGREWG